ncbi:MAG: hypothetical protein IJU50_05380, partial [Lachnospiraceae bacterium]|nr:hypothetical protein [Lachnospiraceae bacterium]
MLIGIFYPGRRDDLKTERKDFGFVRDEYYGNMKDVSRDFDEDFLKKMDISETIIKYWRETGFSPGHYQRFVLLERNRHKYTYEEYKSACNEMLPAIRQENARIEEALSDYLAAEDRALEWFRKPMEGYIYELSDKYDDGSGGTLFMSTDWDAILGAMAREASENKDIDFEVSRYACAAEGGIFSVDFQDFRGRMEFNNNGEIMDFGGIDKYQYEYMDLLPLLSPYMVLPFPFKEKDFVQWKDYKGEDIFSLVSSV